MVLYKKSEEWSRAMREIEEKIAAWRKRIAQVTAHSFYPTGAVLGIVLIAAAILAARRSMGISQSSPGEAA